MQPKYKTDLELVGVAKILYELWDNSHYSMGKLGSDKILEKMIYYFGKNWMKDMTEFAGIHEQSCTPLKTLQELEHEIEPLNMKTIKRLNLTKLWLSVSWGDSPTTLDWSVEVDLNKPFKFVELPNGRIGFTQIEEHFNKTLDTKE